MNENVTFKNDSGEVMTASLISGFNIPEIQKNFVITTANEIDPNGLVVLNVSQLDKGKLIKVENEDDWGKIKNIMRSVISSSAGEFKYIYNLNIDSGALEFARSISVQVVAKDQLVKDYNDKKGTEVVDSNTPAVGVAEEVVSQSISNPAISGAMPGIGESEVAQGIVEVAPVSSVEPVVTPEASPVIPTDVAPTVEPVVAPEIAPIEPVVPTAPVEEVNNQVTDFANTVAPIVPTEPIVEPVSNVDTDQVLADAEREFIESAKKLVSILVEKKINETK